MRISRKFGEPSCCSFPLRVLMLKISTRSGGVANAKPKYHRMPPVDTIIEYGILFFFFFFFFVDCICSPVINTAKIYVLAYLV